MSVLYWEKPAKAETTEEWSSRTADSAPPGVYQPNMSDEDKVKWRAVQRIKRTNDPRIEIRTQIKGSNMVIVVRPEGNAAGVVRISLNGPVTFSQEAYDNFLEAIREAKEVLAGALA